jgi:hypothetical protein
MAQYKFNKDWSGGTYRAPGVGAATSRVDYKKGDVVEGTQIRNEINSEPPTFIEFQSKMGAVRVGYGGRAGSPLDLVSGGNMAGRTTSTEAGFFTKKNIIIAVVVVVIVAAIIYFIKRKKQ